MGVGSGSYNSPEFESFARTFRKELKTQLNNAGFSFAVYDVGHFYVSGFFRDDQSGQLFYFSLSDVRSFPFDRLLVRTATDIKDYTGGPNNYVRLEQFGEDVHSIRNLAKRR